MQNSIIQDPGFCETRELECKTRKSQGFYEVKVWMVTAGQIGKKKMFGHFRVGAQHRQKQRSGKWHSCVEKTENQTPEEKGQSDGKSQVKIILNVKLRGFVESSSSCAISLTVVPGGMRWEGRETLDSLSQLGSGYFYVVYLFFSDIHFRLLSTLYLNTEFPCLLEGKKLMNEGTLKICNFH